MKEGTAKSCFLKPYIRKGEKVMLTYRIYNRETGEVLEKSFAIFDESEFFEYVLDFLGAEYEVYFNGEKL